MFYQIEEKFAIFEYKYGTKAFDSLAQLLNKLGNVSPEWFMKKQGEIYFQSTYESLTGKKAIGKDYKEFVKLLVNLAALYSVRTQILLAEIAKRNNYLLFQKWAYSQI